MKKRINTLMYDTDTAKKLGDLWSDYAPNDFRWWHEALYKKRSGEYFLFGEGGPMSQYSKFAYQGGPEDVTGGEDITPLDFEEARKWYENANNDDEKFAPNEVYEREFETDNLTDDPVDTYSIRLHKSTKIKLQRMAQQQKTDQSKIIENLINNS